ncbi:MAG: ABC transporter ATP-binding protein [Bacilli bacterium]|nr:ABC transporter ATP-binding protein [Bacilli bacterium]
MSIIKLENVYFSYTADKDVLKDIDMEFEKGKVYGVFGKSGAGKSTLLSLIAGLETVKKGQILYKGKNLNKMNKDDYRSNEIGVIFQSYNLLPHLTALENVVLSMDISKVKMSNKKQEELAIKLLDRVGIDEEKAKRKILQLSGGEQQRVSIARALSYGAEVILADEPTGNLDKETENEIIEILTSLAHDDNKCVIIISHSSKIKQKVDILYYLVNGKLEDSKASKK